MIENKINDQSSDARVESSDVLPRPQPEFDGEIGRTAKDSRAGEPSIIRAPSGAPNVLVVLLDDVGFAQFGTFGGAIPTPVLDRLAADGLRYNRYHTTAICSPTRACMLTGRNHHATGNGTVTEYAMGYPGYNGMWPKTVACIAEVLRQNGYATGAFGKWHNTPNWETNLAGPFDRWPTGQGFEYFYGFMGGAAHQWEPTLYENTRPVVRSAPRGEYHLTTELADRAISWVRTIKSVAPDKPFFLWLATGATHAPHQVAKKWIDRFQGKFDAGWDVYRQDAFDRQKRLGVIPADAELTPRPKELPAWDGLTSDEKRLYVRMMEVFAAFTAHTDYELGRVFDMLRESGEYDNTLIIYSVGDNGASGEGGLQGNVNGMSFFNDVPETVETMLKEIDEIGGPKHYNNFPAGWGWAMNAPFQWVKRVASHLGGMRNPLVVTWPKRIKDKGGLRSQFHHAIDITPTILEAAGLKMPASVNGAPQRPVDGTSMVYTFDDPAVPDRHTKQYFEVLGNRAIYYHGWWACALEILPWVPKQGEFDLEASKWELYNLNQDFSQAHDLAARFPAKLRELQDLFWIEAAKNNVLPIDVGSSDRMLGAQALAGVKDRTHYTFYSGTVGIFESAAPNIKNRSFSIVASVKDLNRDTEGVLVSMGGRIGGYSLFVRDGKLHFWYNMLGLEQVCVTSTTSIPADSTRLGVEFLYDGNGLGKGGVVQLTIDDRFAGEGRLERTVARIFARATFDIGMDPNSPVGDYESPFAFTGGLERVDIDLK